MKMFEDFLSENKKITFTSSKSLDLDTLEKQLEKNKEVDVEYEDGKQYFIPPYLHVNGDLDVDDDAEEFPAYTEKGEKVKLSFDKVKSIK